MNKQNFITITLIISGLSLNPVMADTVLTTVVQSQNISEPVSTGIASLLYNRGLDKEAAEQISENFVSESDEVLLALLIEELDRQNIVSRKEVLEYLTQTALRKQKFDFHSYDHLVRMVTTIHKKSLDNKTLNTLSMISKSNQKLFV